MRTEIFIKVIKSVLLCLIIVASFAIADTGIFVRDAHAVVCSDGLDDDGDTLYDEELIDGLDNDGDFLIDEDTLCCTGVNMSGLSVFNGSANLHDVAQK